MGPLASLVCLCACALAGVTDGGATGASANRFDPFNDKVLFGMDFAVGVPDDVSQYWPSPITIKSNKNEGYSCYLPKPLPTDDEDAEKSAEIDGPKLLKKLKDKCLRRLDVYWSYELCVDQHVRQYHEDAVTNAKGDKTKKVTEHFLGRSRKVLLERGDADKLKPVNAAPQEKALNSDGVPTFKYNGKDTPYYSESYFGGDTCDLTGHPRTTEVRYICDKKAYHAMEVVQETTTCNYLIVVHTKFLCQHAAFRLEGGSQHTIACVAKDAAADGSEVAEGKPLGMIDMERVYKEELADLAKREAEEEAAHKAQLQQEEAESQLKGRRPVEPAKATGWNAGTAGTAGNADQAQVYQQAKVAAQARLKAQAAEQTQQDTDAPPSAVHQAMLKKFLKGNHCFSGGQGWWQFEFCYMNYVQQIHRNDDGSKVIVKLGAWDEKYHRRQYAAAAKNENKVKGSKLPSVTQYYKDGDFCEETKGNRKVRVKMQCSKSLKGGQVSLSLEESHTCQYLLRVQSPMFCGLVEEVGPHGMFKLT